MLNPTYIQNDAMIIAMDRAVGRMHESLEAHGLVDNTLIIFLSDHGGVVQKKNKPAWADNGPVRAGKGTLWEGGLRTPLFFRWPNGLPAGETLEGTVSSLDLVPTLVSVAGGEVQSDWELDGINLLPYLTGERNAEPLAERTLFWRQNAMWAVRSGSWKLIQDRGNNPPQLYNLDDDPREATDVVNAYPEEAARLQETFDAWQGTVESPRFGWWSEIGPKVE
ncbi:sulfatase-like hydrolase/transferase [Algisphaera agarilytica]|uniref:Arylsulfatase A-like enzyme n=1 Tax=Algisphaera agarilytica TaxID=1385975 RepID=A0A7X0LJV3_9BACT|nr:sulfatase-like hydrolase/transferase [Algisphaera agarilytica]MBB6429164.1 arylsulfatase A-like enzyme [Algisphaera agarilytica]